MEDLIGVDVEARKTAPTPRRSTLPARHAQTRAFRRAARLTLPRRERPSLALRFLISLTSL